LLARNDVIVVESLEEAITLAITAFPDKKPFLIGGGMLYNEAIEKDFVKEFFLTVVKTSIQGDAIVKFPKFSDSSKWEYCNEESVLADDSNEFKSIFFDVRRK
jgi:dihydrofolate reductase